MVTFEDIRNNAEIRTYIEKGNENLGVLGFTKHSIGHATKVSDMAARILEELNYDARTVELARIAGYMHDIGNCVNRTDHAHSGAIMAMTILRSMGMDAKEIAVVIAAIGNHDEKTVNGGGRGFRRADSGGQDRRTSKPRAGTGSNQIRHPRPSQFCGHQFSVADGSGKAADYAGYPARRRDLLRAGLFRNLSGAHADVPPRGRDAGVQLQAQGERLEGFVS